jgi:nucleoside-diphosphate-sugar epimerase
MNARFHPLSGKTILVVGAGGFIGSAITEFLASLSVRVRALLGPPDQPAWNAGRNVETFRADIRDLATLCELAEGADVVVHAAGPPSVSSSFEVPVDCASIHTLGTVTLLEACRKAAVPRFVYLSSAEVYGRPSAERVDEKQPLQPLSPYGAAKAAAEIFVTTMTRLSNVKCTILRPFSVYGPRQSPESLMGTILRQVQQDRCVCLSDLRPVRDYCYVRDLAEAVALACSTSEPDGIFNIASGEGSSVEQLAKRVLGICHRDISVQQKNQSERAPDAEIFRLVADIGKARNLLGWEPRTTLEDGIRETVAWMQLGALHS